MHPTRSRDLFGVWLLAVSLAVAVAAGSTTGVAILRSAGWDDSPAVIPVSLTELPEPEQPIPLPEPEPVTESDPEPITEPIAVSSPLPVPAEAPAEADEEPEDLVAKPAVETPGPDPLPEPAAAPPRIESRPRPAPKPERTARAASAPNLSRPAQVLRQSSPRYPTAARRAGAAGTAHVSVRLSTSGAVQSAAISRSSGHRALDAEALRTVRRWRFSPARASNGAPAPSQVHVPIRFELR